VSKNYDNLKAPVQENVSAIPRGQELVPGAL